MHTHPTYELYRPLLTNLAYRMLGSKGDAEDIVQDVFLDYHQREQGGIQHEKAYLARMVTNRCLNVQGSARKRRETYVGNWLPEPDVAYGAALPPDPLQLWERNETITYAMLVMLEQLSGIERAVFLLRETLAFSYDEIAEIVGKSEANCRKIISRAKAKLGDAPDTPPFYSERAAELAKAFITAAETGNTEALLGLLTEDAVMISDGGGKVRAAIFPILGRERILAFYEGLARKGVVGRGYIPASVNGQFGFLLFEEGELKRVLTFQWDAAGERLQRVFLIMNPDKLTSVTNQPADLS
ncbi:RNA polymerase sigma factor SigJ [Paenibacillus sp. PL2-23]|uniref:RNA polymerase sigma factor SigJ n=1 Tax=Paenibacillus sp. PL2-23 TaxID=2100729 RepID=UPI0030FB0606